MTSSFAKAVEEVQRSKIANRDNAEIRIDVFERKRRIEQNVAVRKAVSNDERIHPDWNVPIEPRLELLSIRHAPRNENA